MERRTYIEAEDKLVVETIYDPTATLEHNKALRSAAPKRLVSNGKTLLHVASITPEHLISLEQKGYDIMANDPDERRRAMVYLQENEPYWLTVNGKPFAAFRPKWQ